jgi:hypothetical protein
MDHERRTVQTAIRLRPTLKELADRAADDEARSFSSLVEWLLTRYLMERGYLSKTKPG